LVFNSHENSFSPGIKEVCDDIQNIRKERREKIREDIIYKNINIDLLKLELRDERTVILIRLTLNG